MTDDPNELASLQIRLTALQQKQISYNHLFNSAAIMRDGSAMDKCRADIHELVDEMLDVSARVYALITQPFAG